MPRSICPRIQVQLHHHAPARHHRELGAFVRYCVRRLERELGASERWVVTIVPEMRGFRSTVAVHDGDRVLQRSSNGLDGALATWDALCILEQALRESRAARTARAFAFDL
ncbi:MAG: hypothetical protein KF773_23795 [Deltaproteobacteria bacterium]|nr:hypothetical protein [Deltaproteobacteria bacterium]